MSLKRYVRGNHAPSMKKELNKAICTSTQLNKNFFKVLTNENERHLGNKETDA